MFRMTFELLSLMARLIEYEKTYRDGCTPVFTIKGHEHYSTPDAPNVQHLNSPKKCCTLGTLLHIGDIALKK